MRNLLITMSCLEFKVQSLTAMRKKTVIPIREMPEGPKAAVPQPHLLLIVGNQRYAIHANVSIERLPEHSAMVVPISKKQKESVP